MSFIHLRTTSAYSLKYGTTHPRDLVERAAQFEMPALALTDRDGVAGAIRFVKSCLAFGVAPIIGVNLKVDLGLPVLDTQSKLESRLTLLAHGDGGWSSLLRLLTGLNMNASDRTPVLTIELLDRFSQYTSNLHVLHGPEAPLSYALAQNRPEPACAPWARGTIELRTGTEPPRYSS
ncbi:MAG: hypothetical protein RL313_843 [Actinomycetota bacterium]